MVKHSPKSSQGRKKPPPLPLNSHKYQCTGVENQQSVVKYQWFKVKMSEIQVVVQGQVFIVEGQLCLSFVTGNALQKVQGKVLLL